MFVTAIIKIKIARSYTPLRVLGCLPSYLQLNCYIINLLAGDDKMNSFIFQLTIVPILAAVALISWLYKSLLGGFQATK
jgi:hypothetical protein